MAVFKAAIADAFTEKPLSGNPAGVVLLGSGPFPDETLAIRIAAELRMSETAFVRGVAEDEFEIKYYTPVCEAALCGHATVAAFTVLRDKCGLTPGEKSVHTTAGDIRVSVGRDAVFLDMAEARTVSQLDESDAREFYRAFALPERTAENGLRPAVVSVGLADIMLPVRDEAELASAAQDEAAVSELSRRLNVTGVHMFCLTDDGFTAHTRNFAPLYGIAEECATGTASGGLFHYLREKRLAGGEARFLQGEAMGRPSVVIAREETGRVRVGGNGAVLLFGEMEID